MKEGLFCYGSVALSFVTVFVLVVVSLLLLTVFPYGRTVFPNMGVYSTRVYQMVLLNHHALNVYLLMMLSPQLSSSTLKKSCTEII